MHGKKSTRTTSKKNTQLFYVNSSAEIDHNIKQVLVLVQGLHNYATWYMAGGGG